MFGVPYHFLAVHFPIVLIAAALLCDLRGEHEAGYRLTFWAAAGGGLAILTGLMLGGGRMSELPVHAGAGIAGGLATIILAMLRYSRRAREDEPTGYPAAWLLLELMAFLAIAIAAVSGHRALLG